MAEPRITRRRTIAIFAGAFAGALVPGGTRARRLEWRGLALGANARIVLDGAGPAAAREALAAVRAEIARLEAVFSLYRTDSELSRLNASGRLDIPSLDMRHLTAIALAHAHATGGAFNPAIQPLWRHLAARFAAEPSGTGPGKATRERLMKLCDYRRIALDAGAIRLGPGMALTFNGIAQGYITDAAAALLRRAGFRNVLVQLGETRALPGRPWAVALEGAGRTIALRDQAVATSAGAGTPLSADGRWHHLLDGRAGLCPHHYRALSVIAPAATEADALSTALYAIAPSALESVMVRFPRARVIATTGGGNLIEAGA